MAYGVVNSGGGSNNTDSLESIKSLVEEVKTNTETIISDDNGLAADHEELKKNHTALSAAIDAVKSVVDAIKTTVNSIKSDTELILDDTSEIKTGVSAIKTVVDAIKSTVNTIKTMITTLSTNVDATKTAAESAQTASEEAVKNSRDLRTLDWTHFESTPTVYHGGDESKYEIVGTILEVDGEGELLDCFSDSGSISTSDGGAVLKITIDGEVVFFGGTGSVGIINPLFIIGPGTHFGSGGRFIYLSYKAVASSMEFYSYAHNEPNTVMTPFSTFRSDAPKYCIFEPIKFSKSLKVEGCKRQADEAIESKVYVNYRLS